MFLVLETSEDGVVFFWKIFIFFVRLYLCRKMWMAYDYYFWGLDKKTLIMSYLILKWAIPK